MSDHDSTTDNESESHRQEQLYSGQHIDQGNAQSNESSSDTDPKDQIGILIDAIKKAVDVCKDPQGCWKTIKEEEWTIEELYKNFLVPLALLAGTCQLFGLVLTVSVVGAVMGTLMSIVMMMGMPFIGAVVVEKCATVFEGSIDLDNALKYVAFTYSSAFLGNMVGILPLPVITGLISILAGLYSIYLFWEGAVPMTNIPQDKKMPFVVMVAAIMLVVAIVLGLIMGFFVKM